MLCKNCRHYEPGRIGEGWCKRYPPVPVYVAYAEETRTQWPETKDEEWCGEFRSQSKPMSAEKRITNKRKKST